jgi:threonine dehydrogenase-like Zn-dependent dehydrogenase
MVRARFSVLSPGTERRHLADTAAGRPRDAGYMTIASDPAVPDGYLLGPVPHGASFAPACPGTLQVPPGVPAELAALARFQQMAVLGLRRLPAGVPVTGAVVAGSGPVALGCALELRRRGAAVIRVLTSRLDPPIAAVPGVLCTSSTGTATASLVIDAAGDPGRALGCVMAGGGILGLLGTPGTGCVLPAAVIHRSALQVIGMHELAGGTGGGYQDAYRTALDWLAGQGEALPRDRWCRTVPGDQAPAILAALGTAARLPEPVVIFTWDAAT